MKYISALFFAIICAALLILSACAPNTGDPEPPPLPSQETAAAAPSLVETVPNPAVVAPSSGETVPSPGAAVSGTAARGIPLTWQSEREIKPEPCPDVDVTALGSILLDPDTRTVIYCDARSYGSNDYYDYYDGGANFLFTLEDVIEYQAIDQVTVKTTVIFSRASRETEPGGMTLSDVLVSQYRDGKLYQTSLSEFFGSDGFWSIDDYYQAFICDESTGYNNVGEDAYYFTDGVFVPVVPGEPDKVGSWANIAGGTERAVGWKQIVSHSEFQLGELWRPGDYQYVKYGAYPNIDGSTVLVPLAMEFARQHLGLDDEDAAEFAMFTTTPNAYIYLLQRAGTGGKMLRHKYGEITFVGDSYGQEPHPVDIVLATYPDAGTVAEADRIGEPLIIEPICADDFVFITHRDNPADSLSLDQIRGIYGGTVTNWRDVGGADLPIAAYQREPGSGSQTGMEQLVMQGAPMASPDTVKVAEGMGHLIDMVAEYQNSAASIGYTYKYYIDNLYKNENIKLLRIDGHAPGEDGYPLRVNYYGVIREKDGENSVGRKFLDWIRSPEGRQCVRQAGYANRAD
jgi:phosphate transport system substrate-binding protein